MNPLALTRSTSSRSLLKPSDSRQNILKPHLYDCRALPREDDNHFVYHTEDLSDDYHEPYDETHPIILVNETNKE